MLKSRKVEDGLLQQNCETVTPSIPPRKLELGTKVWCMEEKWERPYLFLEVGAQVEVEMWNSKEVQPEGWYMGLR